MITDENRGKIRNREAFRQIINKDGMRFENNITGTDIDDFYDFGNKAFVFVELKYKDAKMERGQQLALERLCAACQGGGVESVIILASHDTPYEEDIPEGDAIVCEYYRNGEWLVPPKEGTTVREVVDKFREYANRHKITLPKGTP